MTEKEKQKSNENKDKMIKTDILNDLKIIKLYKPPVISNSSNTEMINKKPTDKIEPKFKVGDWVVFVKSESTYQVEKIENYEYTLKHVFGSSLCLPFSDENLIREWTIQDAKDGDILSKFTANWLKKERFDPKTLKPFNKVLVRDSDIHMWKCNLFSHIIKNGSYPYQCSNVGYLFCIPYNDDTKHLVGTTEEAPEYYRYWED